MKTKKQLEEEIEKFKERFKDWEEKKYPNVDTYIEDVGDLDEVSDWYELKATLTQTNEIIKLIENFPTQTLRKRTTLDEEDVFDVIIKKEILTKLRGGK